MHINHGTLTINTWDEPFNLSAPENDAGYFDYYTKNIILAKLAVLLP